MRKDYNMNRHPEGSEGSWCRPAAATLVGQARTKIPRVARDDKIARDDKRARDDNLCKRKTGSLQSEMMPEAHSNCRFPNRMTLTQGAFMLLTLPKTRNET